MGRTLYNGRLPTFAIDDVTDVCWRRVVFARKLLLLNVAARVSLAYVVDLLFSQLRRADSFACRLPSLLSHVARIVGARAEGQMRRTHAARIVALVKNRKIVGQIVVRERIGDAMCSHRPVTNAEATIALLVKAATPEPAIFGLLKTLDQNLSASLI